MGGLDYRCEREWVVFTIEEELGNLERLASTHQQFSDRELDVLHQSLVRLNRIVTNLDKDTEEEPLPHWLQRKSVDTTASGTDDDKSAASA